MNARDEDLSTRDLIDGDRDERREADVRDERPREETLRDERPREETLRDEDAHAEADRRTPADADRRDVPGEAAPAADDRPRTDGAAAAEGEAGQLFSEDDSRRYLDKWESIQATFVDDPRAAVEYADGLVADVIRRLAEVFSEEREHLEGQWSSGGDASTEDLRVALQRYRAFFRRLLEM